MLPGKKNVTMNRKIIIESMMICWLKFQNLVWNDDLLTEDDDKDHKVTGKHGFGPLELQMSKCTRVCSVASVMSGSLWPHKLQPTRLLCPQNSPGKNTGVGCHFLFQSKCIRIYYFGRNFSNIFGHKDHWIFNPWRHDNLNSTDTVNFVP